MSFPPFGPNPLEADVAQERQREIEAEAARYAERHPDDDRGDPQGAIRRVLRRARALLTGRT